MDISSLHYFVELCKDLNMTKTADRLYTSQQTLSNHIQRVEEHYGIKLFDRRPTLRLTIAGREVLSFAERLLAEEKNLKSILSDVVNLDRGEIVIGASSPRSNAYLPQILPSFTKTYPNVQIILVDKTSDQLEKLVLKNELDFAFCVNAAINQRNFVAEAMLNDLIYFCVSDKLLYKHYGDRTESIKKKALPGAYMADFSELPFLTIMANNRLGQCIHACFQEAGYTPHSYMMATYTT
ncbi:MAG: LysR family transcriptional regulator, partial [Synergistaceae bacterium]|nr:LysR family transcriptional regulator [Synergistaceae bacterium]